MTQDEEYYNHLVMSSCYYFQRSNEAFDAGDLDEAERLMDISWALAKASRSLSRGECND